MEENVLDTEVEAAEEAEEIFEETEEVVADDNQEDDEFEYDEEGNIVIPEVEFEDEEYSEEEEDTDTEEDESENADEENAEEETADPDGEPAKEQEKAEGKEEEPEAKPDPRDARIKELEDKLRAIESQSKDTLKKLGKENVDLIDGLAELAAEATGKPLKEYKEEREKELREQLEQERQRNIAFEAKAQSDLKELHLAYPETQKYKHVRELPAEILQKFGKYRELGLPAKEAYAAANPDGVRADVAASVKKQAMHDSKAHLQSTVPKSSKNDGVVMSKAELISWREMFPNMSDAEIKKLYKQSQ